MTHMGTITSTKMDTYIATYTNGTNIPFLAIDEEEAAWYAKGLSYDYNTELIDLIPLRLWPTHLPHKNYLGN